MRIGTVMLAAVIALVLAGCFGEEDSTTEPVSSTANTPPEVTRVPGEEILRIGNEWAPLFAAAPNPEACREEAVAKYMTQPACEQAICEQVGHIPIEHCTPLSPGFQKSFADATAQLVKIKGGYRAAAKFSNGEAVEFFGDGGSWHVSEVGGNAGRGFFK